MNYINPNAPAAGLTRLLNMRDNNPATQLAYVPTRDIAAMGSMGGLEFNPYSGIPQARGIAAVADGGSIQDAPLAPVADELASRGRYGDSMLLHVRPDELQGLASLGTLTINPDTGLPEAFNFKSLLPAVGAIAGSVLLGPAFAPVFGSAFGVGIGAGLGSFAGGLAAGQKPGQAALGGLMSGATAGFMQGLAPTGFEQGVAPPAETFGGGMFGETLSGAAGQSMQAASASSLGATAGTEFGSLGAGVPITPNAIPTVTPAPTIDTSLISKGISPGETYFKYTGETTKPGAISKFFGAEPTRTGDIFSRQAAIDKGFMPSDMTISERAGQVLTDPKTYVGAGINTLMQPPPEMEYQEPEPLTFSSYTPRERTLAGGVQSPARSSEEYLRMALEGGYQPLSEQYRYAAQGGLVGLEEGGQPSSLTAMSITPESQRVRNDTSQPQQNISNRFFDELESKGGIMSIMSRLLLRNNPEAIQFVNQNASSPRNLQLNEMGAGRHSYFDTADTGLYPKAAGGLVRLVEGGTPEQGVMQSQLSPVLQQQQQTPLLQQQEQQISERARQDELLQRDQAMSRGQQFIEQPTGNQQLFQQMQAAGQVIGQQLAQGPQAYATPAGSKAPSTSFSTGADFGFNAGGLVGLAEGGTVSLRRGGEPDQIEKSLPITLQSTMKRLGIKDATPFLEFAQKTKQIESSGGIDRINKKSSARGDFQWLTKVDPKAKKGEHGSVKTAVNRTITSYKRMGQEIPQWLKTLNKNSTKSTKDLEENVLSLTPAQELELFFGNIGEAEGSDTYLTGIAQGDKEAMFGAYSDIHHTRGREDKPTKEKAVKVFFSETAPQVDRSSAPNLLEENMVDTRSNELYTVQPGDTLSRLAAKSGMSVEDLMSVNLSRISDPNKIYTGQQIALSDSPDIPNPVPVSEGDEDGLMNLIKNLLPDFITRAEGGEIGKYFEGQVVGNGDGMSDQILFEVEGNNPDKALLSRDEYVIPADVVAMLGNGSSNAGSEQLDSFIKGIRQDSFGTQKQQRQLNAQQGLRGLV